MLYRKFWCQVDTAGAYIQRDLPIEQLDQLKLHQSRLQSPLDVRHLDQYRYEEVDLILCNLAVNLNPFGQGEVLHLAL